MRLAAKTGTFAQSGAANPKLPLFLSLDNLLRTYPTALRDSLLDHLHRLLVETLPGDPAALKLHATRLLPGDPEASEEFVDKLRAANEKLLGWARSQGGAVAGAYADFVEEWCQRDVDANLVGKHVTLLGCS